MAGPKMTKNQMRRAKKKVQKKAKVEAVANPSEDSIDKPQPDSATEEPTQQPADGGELAEKKDASTTEPTPADGPAATDIDVTEGDPAFSMFKDIFTKFGVSRAGDEVEREANAGNKGEVFFDQDDDIPSEDESGEPKLSKKKRKQLNKLSIAELKALVRKPEVVEWHDVSSTDPRLLVQIKASRNVVPVPSHWSLKREYLSSKRGIEKPPFKLPKCIAETGITQMRDAVLEKQEQQTLKQKQRERVNPKMGRLDIDYQKLYDAFFRFQTKPELTRYGEVYYEGKEWEMDFRHFRPGDLTDVLKEALSIPPGAPPPWLINQQRFGPPPSYPNLKLPGLNAPPPAGAQWGFHPGGYGKPPVDEFNRPLFGGDIFGIAPGGEKDNALRQQGEPVVKTLWGELQPREEESESEEEGSDEESDEEEDEDMAAGGMQTPAGAATGFASTAPTDFGHGVETSIAGDLDLRKSRPSGIDTEDSTHPRSAYTVIPERAVRAEGFFGSDRVYDLKQNPGARVLGHEDESRKRKKPGDVDVALDPDQLAVQDGMSKDELTRRYEEGRKEDGVGAQWSRPYEDDLTQMIAEESRKRQKRDEDKRSDRRKDAGKYKF
ncbi:splicing factor [Zalerion maritima]|uniref:Splicing factor n=1 Tax=Zalerion maritima TaxID=339359 RepID=A0AAD5WR01_9PEZI|nr:splicing factor [Zalerion maritima]